MYRRSPGRGGRQEARPTITTYDIAQYADVRQSTVSRALAGSVLIHPAPVAKVREACKKLDFVPNTLRHFVAAFHQAMPVPGADTPPLIHRAGLAFSAARVCAEELPALGAPPTAWVTTTPLAVFGVMEATKQASPIPPVLGGELPRFRFLYPGAPYIAALIEELGRTMVRALTKLIRTERQPAAQLLPTRIIDEPGHPFQES
jgi:DNA-binding LacI/PurR family transcriptional regulator